MAGSLISTFRRCTLTHKLQALSLAVGLLYIPAVLAHHAWPVNQSTLVTVTGTVTAFSWANPHPMIALNVELDDGAKEEWSIGGPAINRMEANGWTSDSIKPGDVITGIGFQFNDGSKIISLEKIILADGKELLLYGGR